MTGLDPKLQQDKGFIARNIYRPVASPNISIPYGLRSMGHCRARVGWRDAPKLKSFVQVFWVVSGVGEFICNDTSHLVKVGECFVYFSQQRHLITAISDYFEYRFFTVDGMLAEEIVRSFDLRNEVMVVGDCPVSEFEILEKEILDVTPYGQVNGSTKAFHLLSKIAGVRKMKRFSPMTEACISQIEGRLHLPDMNINLLAKELEVHRSQLARQFKKELGMSPIDFLISKRVQKGIRLLEEGKLSIKEIARQCGYQQPDYFAKAIRRVTGLKPREVRGF